MKKEPEFRGDREVLDKETGPTTVRIDHPNGDREVLDKETGKTIVIIHQRSTSAATLEPFGHRAWEPSPRVIDYIAGTMAAGACDVEADTLRTRAGSELQSVLRNGGNCGARLGWPGHRALVLAICLP